MKILAVDDENLMLERLCRCIKEAKPDSEVIAFRRAAEALEYTKKQHIDVAFLDIHMRNMDGMELAKQIKLINPKINIIFATSYTDYIYDAVSEVRCSGYIMKPVTTEQILKELENLRNSIEDIINVKVFVRCFGNFDVFVNGEALYFDSAKAKELLAYLVDRNGAVCTNGEISATLWEDDEDHYSYLKKCKKTLNKILTDAGCEDILVSFRGSVGVNKEKFKCDYYDWLDGKAGGINAYHGEYITQYSWGEITNASLIIK